MLGDHHDSVVARTVLLDLAGKAREAGEDTFTYGLMYQRQADQAARHGASSAAVHRRDACVTSERYLAAACPAVTGRVTLPPGSATELSRLKLTAPSVTVR